MKICSSLQFPSSSLVAVTIGCIFLLLACSPFTVSGTFDEKKGIDDTSQALIENGEQELYLLRGEHYLVVNATASVGEFHIQYAFPPDYVYQTPVLFELHNDSTAPVLSYRIENEENEPNKIMNFTIGPLASGASVLIHFSVWVMIHNHDYSDLPRYVKLPKKWQLPQETRIWLSSTDVVQARNILIKHTSHQLEIGTTNLMTFAKRTVFFTKYHHYLRFVIQYYLGTYRRQDALTTLFRNGECPGRSHLECALFRANHVPARVILATPHYDFWYQVHCLVEFYCPGYGWILSEVHDAKMAHEPKNQIIMRICYPVDEDNTGQDYFFPKMSGVERWYWIDTSKVVPYYKDFVEGSKSNMFPEQNCTTAPETATLVASLSKSIFSYYQHYLGMDLSGENLDHFNQAVSYQQQGLQSFIDTKNPEGYLSFFMNAYQEYQHIQI